MSVKQPHAGAPIVLRGYLKKLKTHRKKYFVLRGDTPDCNSAQLEYYDSERKFLAGQPPKRSIKLGTCFNINRRMDTKYKYVIALYIRQEELNIVLDNEEEYNLWFKNILDLQRGRDRVSGDIPQPNFAHVWNVHILNRGLGSVGIIGEYRLCLTSDALNFVKPDMDVPLFELKLFHIRSCGNLRDFFFLEVGRSSSIGAGELWMETEDPYIAQNVHSTVFHAMCTRAKDKNFRIDDEEDLSPKSRTRSSSATETSKPQILQNSRTIFSQVNGAVKFCQEFILSRGSRANRRHSISGESGARGRCDSMPTTIQQTNRNRTISEGASNQLLSRFYQYRPNSLSHSPPQYTLSYGNGGSPMSPPSEQGSGSSYSIADETDGDLDANITSFISGGTTGGRYSHSLTPEEAIVEEDYTENFYNNYLPMSGGKIEDGYVDMSPKTRQQKSPTTSMSSVTSGTPSTDIKFADYPLEKVTSYFGQHPQVKQEQQQQQHTFDEDNTRPIRAYSVGSRPDLYRNCLKHLDMQNMSLNNDLRTRAFSVGSKLKKPTNRVLPQIHNNIVNYGNNSKSSSAPILSLGGGSSASYRSQGSHSSIGPMDDLMEMDFSRTSSINSGYMDMNPKFHPQPVREPQKNNGYVEMKLTNNKTDPNSYVEMKPGTSPSTVSSLSDKTQDETKIVVQEIEGDYMVMDHNKYRDNPEIIGSKTNFVNRTRTDYIDMTVYIDNNNEHSPDKAPKTDYMEMHYNSKPQTAQTTKDGYVEMNLGRNFGHQRSLSENDYTNMNLGKKDKKEKKKDKSQPINIQHKNQNSNTNNAIFPFFGRKSNSGNTPPKTLPLQNYTSPPIRNGSSPNSNVTTPSSSSTIFPLSLNSPCSPIKTETTSSIGNNIKVPSTVLNTVYKSSNKFGSGKIDDYTCMDFNNTKNNGTHEDYVNFQPSKGKCGDNKGNDDDYAVMKPGVVETRVFPVATGRFVYGVNEPRANCFRPINENREEPSSGTQEKTPDSPISGQNTSDYEQLRTKPQQQQQQQRSNSVTNNENSSLKTNNTSRPSSVSSELCSSSSSTLVSSRPESVNSCNSGRSSCEHQQSSQLHYASLDLEDGNRSPRTAKTGETNSNSEPTLTYAAIDFVKSEGLKQKVKNC